MIQESEADMKKGHVLGHIPLFIVLRKAVLSVDLDYQIIG